MLAMITNDDGIESRGIAVLARAAIGTGLDVVVAAPCWDSSGASASLAAVEHDGRFLVADREVDGVTGRCLALEAAPAFIVRAALSGAFGVVPDVVLSGINRGTNTGHAVLHSGTVGAASTAATFDRPAAAFSVGSASPTHWETAEAVTTAVLDWFGRRGRPGAVLNVNVPDIAPNLLRGVRVATLAPFGAVTTRVTESGAGSLTLRYEEPGDQAAPGTDVALLAEGFATVTVLSPVCERQEPTLDELVADDIPSRAVRPLEQRRSHVAGPR